MPESYERPIPLTRLQFPGQSVWVVVEGEAGLEVRYPVRFAVPWRDERGMFLDMALMDPGRLEVIETVYPALDRLKEEGP